jgi:hypothetical protein
VCVYFVGLWVCVGLKGCVSSVPRVTHTKNKKTASSSLGHCTALQRTRELDVHDLSRRQLRQVDRRAHHVAQQHLAPVCLLLIELEWIGRGRKVGWVGVWVESVPSPHIHGGWGEGGPSCMPCTYPPPPHTHTRTHPSTQPKPLHSTPLQRTPAPAPPPRSGAPSPRPTTTRRRRQRRRRSGGGRCSRARRRVGRASAGGPMLAGVCSGSLRCCASSCGRRRPGRACARRWRRPCLLLLSWLSWWWGRPCRRWGRCCCCCCCCDPPQRCDERAGMGAPLLMACCCCRWSRRLLPACCLIDLGSGGVRIIDG